MSQHFNNTFVFSCGGLIFYYFILTYERLIPQLL